VRDAGARADPLRPSAASKNGKWDGRYQLGGQWGQGGIRYVHETRESDRRPTEGKQAVTPTKDWKSGELYTALAVTVIVITAGILLTSGFLRLVDRLAPQIGDIIAFPATRVPSISSASFAASRVIAPDSVSCILDVQIMQKSGGSLVVESRQLEPSRIFQVHWAGGRTSNDRDDCGGSADLLLSGNQISALIFAAGGTGVKAQN
jgi:hypothetical protein